MKHHPAAFPLHGIVAALVRHDQPPVTHTRLIELIRKGFPFSEFTRLQREMDLPMDSLARLIHVSRSTLHRQKTTHRRLDQDQSDKLVRYAHLVGKAKTVFGDISAARNWLTSPQIGLDGQKPLEYATTEVGAREVENLLGRIEYGVYS